MSRFFRMHAIFNNLLTTRRLSKLTFLFLGLGICVFTWGLQYKLSLYYPPQSSVHRIPEAKLLSKEEQPRIAADLPTDEQPTDFTQHLPRDFAGLVLGWLTCVTLGLSLRPERRPLPSGDKPWLLAVQASLNPFFFRPPPYRA